MRPFNTIMIAPFPFPEKERSKAYPLVNWDNDSFCIIRTTCPVCDGRTRFVGSDEYEVRGVCSLCGGENYLRVNKFMYMKE